MTKQELIESLRTKEKMCFQAHYDAACEWKEFHERYGGGHILTRCAAEKMEAFDARIDEIHDFIEMLESLED